ncbi:MAG: SDR family oxidoreductase, partial [Paludibacteraceae bacterium]|nr:SDR family oxidoreductase [Paludibacteraceae bacterium]
DEQFLTNVKGPFFLTQAFLKYIEVERVNSSSVLVITSERGLYPDDAPYGMTKAAIGNIVAGLARKFATMGVHINAIAPGVVADVLADPKKMEDLYLKGAAGKRFILPQEIAETAVWLMSDASKCVSGEIIPCNQCNHLK